MRYYKKLYVGDNVTAEDLDKIKQGLPVFNIYALCVCDSTNGLFEILSTNELFKPHSLNKNYGVVALMVGDGSVKRAVCEIMVNWLSSHEGLDGIREYYNRNSF